MFGRSFVEDFKAWVCLSYGPTLDASNTPEAVSGRDCHMPFGQVSTMLWSVVMLFHIYQNAPQHVLEKLNEFWIQLISIVVWFLDWLLSPVLWLHPRSHIEDSIRKRWTLYYNDWRTHIRTDRTFISTTVVLPSRKGTKARSHNQVVHQANDECQHICKSQNIM